MKLRGGHAAQIASAFTPSTLTVTPSILCLLFALTATFPSYLGFTDRRYRRHEVGG
jgi:hypothetical protein